MKSPSSPREALVEEYVPGVEVAVEGILIAGELKLLAIFDKPDPLEGPFFEESIYVTPSHFSAAQQSAIRDRAIQAIRAIGLTHGPVHAEFRINERGVWPIEVAPRPIGGMCAASLSFVSSRHRPEPDTQNNSHASVDSSSESHPSLSAPISLEEVILRHTIGENIYDWQRESAASGVMMIPVPSSGILENVTGIDEAKRVQHIMNLQITARLHDEILAWPEGSSYLGFIFAKAESPAAAEHALRQAHSKLHFQIQPTLPVEHPVTGKVFDPRNSVL